MKSTLINLKWISLLGIDTVNKITLYTIGFTKKSAEAFFSTLSNAHVTLIIDIRLNNVSQLSGFAKKDDLEFFLKKICQCNYLHEPLFAPTQDILEAYRNKDISWDEYKDRFRKLIQSRKIENTISKDSLSNSCLLCSEPTANKCHRRLVAEYLKEKLSDIEIKHL
jgi:uncharacterized protein (DUF488 family)